MNKSISEKILEVGVDNLRFFIPMKKHLLFSFSESKETWVECYISESTYRIKDDYKITLVSIDQEYNKKDFYLSDFESLLEEGFIIQKTSFNQHVENVTWYENIGGLNIAHNANILIK